MTEEAGCAAPNVCLTRDTRLARLDPLAPGEHGCLTGRKVIGRAARSLHSPPDQSHDAAERRPIARVSELGQQSLCSLE
ncbi:hypothetical protein ANO14919_130880 [Xylariales sp. No.14919]|nr:hypothetical protein ANO14919_130880 [Xylariales sp. No.14919]